MAKSKPKARNKAVILNRRARYDYNLGEELTVGLVLNGKQVRAARDGRVQLKGSYVTVRGGELWLNNASWTLKLNEPGKNENVVNTEPIKLLANRKQILGLIQAKQDGNTIAALRLHVAGRLIKLVIATGKGKKKYDKRETIKRRESEREAKRSMKR
ncbi:MAG: SsrA-binding protein SmpB [Candidatus Nomurabacteria bacterium]|jgi:SsrA-binding protein|nr:SsrA-binding protein SmpB [Candidatus Nomurabacteria bacterium]